MANHDVLLAPLSNIGCFSCLSDYKKEKAKLSKSRITNSSHDDSQFESSFALPSGMVKHHSTKPKLRKLVTEPPNFKHHKSGYHESERQLLKARQSTIEEKDE